MCVMRYGESVSLAGFERDEGAVARTCQFLVARTFSKAIAWKLQVLVPPYGGTPANQELCIKPWNVDNWFSGQTGHFRWKVTFLFVQKHLSAY
jgi:hypothetical protein